MPSDACVPRGTSAPWRTRAAATARRLPSGENRRHCSEHQSPHIPSSGWLQAPTLFRLAPVRRDKAHDRVQMGDALCLFGRSTAPIWTHLNENLSRAAAGPQLKPFRRTLATIRSRAGIGQAGTGVNHRCSFHSEVSLR